MVPGRLHTDHHHTGVQPAAGGGDQALELGQPSHVGDQPDAIDHDLPRQVLATTNQVALATSMPTSRTRCGSTPRTSSRNSPPRWPPMWAPCIIGLPLSVGYFPLQKERWQEGAHS
jgi:hypothetical protein